MIRDFEYLIVFTSAPGVLPEQNDWYRIQPWKVNEIKVYKNIWKFSTKLRTGSEEKGKNLFNKFSRHFCRNFV